MGPASKPVWLGQLELRVFFFFLQKPCLSLSPGALVLLMPRGRDGPGFQADVARSAGALDLFFFFFFFPPEALSVPVTGGPVRLRPRESYGRGFLSLTCRSYQFSRLSGRPVVPLRSGSFRYGVIFGPPPQV